MRKPLRIVRNVVIAIVVVPVLLLATTAGVNVVLTDGEASSVTRYGQLVPVDGKQMNVVIAGSGEQTVVLLPGLGTAAPALDFEPLIRQLQSSYRVIAVEPFGTGLSDQTDSPRTAANITREIHEALQRLGVDRYVLMGHSIAGIYALTYSAAYADELVAFVGIDSSVPDQPGSETPIPTGAIVAMSRLGLTRLIVTATVTDTDQRLLTLRNSAAPTMLDEMEHVPANFAAISAMTFPATLPVLLFVRSNDIDVADWVALHEKQAASVRTGKVVLLNGDHYLHHTLAPEITEATRDFLTSQPG